MDMEGAEQGALEDPLRCASCGAVIGVYEPVVHVVDGTAHRTSRAADSHLAQSRRGMLYHAACYARDAGEGAGVN
jgi:hypothetical protein